VTIERWDRRSFLLSSLTGASALVGAVALPVGAGAAARRRGGRAPARPTVAATPRPGVSTPPALPGRLRLYATSVKERLEVTYRDASGTLDPQALQAINYLLRCHATGEVGTIDVDVLDFLGVVDGRLGGDREVHVISGFRSREYNDWLARRSRRVARDSLHLRGRAIDLRIPGVAARSVRQVALRVAQGGVGYYPRAGFVHLDSGPFRHW